VWWLEFDGRLLIVLVEDNDTPENCGRSWTMRRAIPNERRLWS
jgi:hypothetical protein